MGARRKRACLLAVIPGDVQDAAVKQCHVTLTTKAEVTPERIKAMLELFAQYNVTKEQIEKRIQRRLDSITPSLFAELGKIATRCATACQSRRNGSSRGVGGGNGDTPSPAAPGVEGAKQGAARRDKPIVTPARSGEANTLINRTARSPSRLDQAEKGGDDSEIVVAKLGIVDVPGSRDQADEILGVPIGWTERLYDELGAPFFAGEIKIAKDRDCSAMIAAAGKAQVRERDAEWITLELLPNEMLMCATLTWPVAGDESADAEDMLGKLCTIELAIHAPQADLLKPAA